MLAQSTASGGRVRPPGFRSLATKFFVFTAALLFWVVLSLFGFDFQKGDVNWLKWAVASVLVGAVAAGLSRFTTRVLARPLTFLEEGIRGVAEGRPEPIQVSRTRDEIEFLGHSFNRMIERLIASQNEVRQHQELLEDRIRQRTEQLEHAMQKAEAASQAKSEFLANMSHELRTPMNGVLGMIDIVLDSPLTGEQREQLETAQRCANSLLPILNDVLDLSKIEAGKMILERIPFDIRTLVDEILRSHRGKASKKGITVSFEVAPDVPRRISGDPLRTRQMLSNLVANAVKFTERGTVRVKVSRASRQNGGELYIDVIDTGVGIPQDKLTCIFEKFTQADGSISRKYGGTGLGLAITRKLVEMHGGDVSVTSTVGTGSTFRITLPPDVCLTETGPGVENLTPAKQQVVQSENPSAPSILVVEDNHVNQKVVTAILRKRGYHVDVANHGRQALEYLELLAYQLVLMDVQMPVLDGLEATRAIRRDPRFRNLPIVAMTAHAMSGDRERCLASGMNGYIAKPLNPSTLLAVVEEHLNPKERPETMPVPAIALKGEDQGLLLEMQKLFHQMAPARIEMFRECVRNLDFNSLKNEAIRLSNSAAQVGAESITEAAKRLEHAAQTGDADSIARQLARIERELLQANAAPTVEMAAG